MIVVNDAILSLKKKLDVMDKVIYKATSLNAIKDR